jgi:hypothetical protein
MVFTYRGTTNPSLQLGTGNVAAPSLGFSNSTSTGFFYSNGNIGITINGIEKMRITSGGLTIHGNITANTYSGDGTYLTAWDSLVVTTVSNVQVADSSYAVLTDNTAVSTSGGFIVINGSGYVGGSMVLVDGTPAISTTVLSFTKLGAQVAAKAAGTYTLSVVRPDSVTVSVPLGITFV